MKFEMNMLTGKYNKICYEAGDVVVPKGAFGNTSAPKSLLLKKEHKHGLISPVYLVFHEDKLVHGDHAFKHSMKYTFLRTFYEPYMNPLSSYK